MRGLAVLALLLLLGCIIIQAQVSPYRYAHVEFASVARTEALTGAINIRGNVEFRQLLSGPVEVMLFFRGFDPRDQYRQHGIHLHEYGDVTGSNCEIAGPHYNPIGSRHGDISDSIFDKHIGDLGNYQEDNNGMLEARFVNDYISLDGNFSIIGRLLGVTVGQDDLGRGGDEQSAIDGNSGFNVGCGVVGHSDSRAWVDD